LLKVLRYRIYPTKSQRSNMANTLELCRWACNETLAIRKNAYEKEGKLVSYYETKKRLPQWKEEKPGLKGIYSQVLQEVVKRVDLAYQAFFRRVKDGEDPGYPRFKGRGRYDSFTYTQSGFSLKPGKLWLSKIGEIKIKLHRASMERFSGLTSGECLLGNGLFRSWVRLN
jgi:putative transposase